MLGLNSYLTWVRRQTSISVVCLTGDRSHARIFLRTREMFTDLTHHDCCAWTLAGSHFVTESDNCSGYTSPTLVKNDLTTTPANGTDPSAIYQTRCPHPVHPNKTNPSWKVDPCSGSKSAAATVGRYPRSFYSLEVQEDSWLAAPPSLALATAPAPVSGARHVFSRVGSFS
jgi:hypothetical protein